MPYLVSTNVAISRKQIEKVLDANGYESGLDAIEELAQAYVDCKVAEYFDMKPLDTELLVQLAHDLDLLQAEIAETDAELRRDFGDAEIRGMR